MSGAAQHHVTGCPFPRLRQGYGSASSCLAFLKKRPCLSHLASLRPTFCTWCLLQEGNDVRGIGVELCRESESTGDLIQNIRSWGEKQKKENQGRLLHCSVLPGGTKQEMLMPVSMAKANLCSPKRRIFIACGSTRLSPAQCALLPV